jgi:lysophospholipase
VSTLEQAYIKQRKTKADAALATWLSKSGLKFVKPKAYPTIGLTSSGGGYRALLCGAGVHQAFDARDSNVSTSGLYQALTYEAGLSGGSWLLSSIAANNWPTISSLVDGLWAEAFEDSLLLPSRALAATAITAVTADIVAKQAAGFPPTLTGRAPLRMSTTIGN